MFFEKKKEKIIKLSELVKIITPEQKQKEKEETEIALKRYDDEINKYKMCPCCNSDNTKYINSPNQGNVEWEIVFFNCSNCNASWIVDIHSYELLS